MVETSSGTPVDEGRADDTAVATSPDGRVNGAPSGRGRQWVVLSLTLAVGLGIGLGAARLASGGSEADSRSSVQSLDVPGDTGDAGGGGAEEAPPPPEADAAPPATSATSPEAAVEGFLTAEALQDFAASYEYLAAVERDTTYPTAGAWEAAHAQLQPIAGYEIEGAEGAEVTTLTALNSRLDPVLGLVPARARGTWTTVEEDDGWRVAYSSSTLEPLYPSDEGVADAVSEWVTTDGACGDTAGASGALLGQRGLAAELCEAGGADATLGVPGVLSDGPDTTVLLNAYGPQVFTWARVVPVEGPVELRLVAAPVGDAWEVFAVLPPV